MSATATATQPECEKMASVTQVQVESVVFPPTAKPPGSDKTLLLGGAGVRGMEIQGNFVKFTAIAVYVEASAIAALATNWSGKTADELAESADFIGEIIAGNASSQFWHFFQLITLILFNFVRSV